MKNTNTPFSSQTLIDVDPWLQGYEKEIKQRIHNYDLTVENIELHSKNIIEFSSTHKYLGFHINESRTEITYREWAPAAKAIHLIGDFNNWNREANPLSPMHNPPPQWAINHGLWEIKLPYHDGPKESAPAGHLYHLAKIKINLTGAMGSVDKLPSHITYTSQQETTDFVGVVYFPKTQSKVIPLSQTDLAAIKKNIFIYEAHTGMAQETEGVGTYREFADKIVPRIVEAGYNTIQLMAVMEHPYYGSYGYHVSNFFAPSSRFGTPEDFKYLVNIIHQNKIAIIIDAVHSHCVKNVNEGLNYFDGSDHQFFHAGGRGFHDLWDSKLFNYGKREVLAFLLSNIRYYMEEFGVDGFRYDGVTSMMYLHHGQYKDFTHYDMYFKHEIDTEAITYLQLSNLIAHQINPEAITVAEDMSGMPGLCRPQSEGGIGFDFRLAMGLPDYWIKIIKEKKDEEWNLDEIWNQLSNRRYGEKSIAYCESHDQALVGDKTIAFRLMDKEMYWHMTTDYYNPIIERGVALHKIIRFLSLTIGGEGWLNFIGNEFGHPEWIDFPREGNGYSYKHARRQWSLRDNPKLWYHHLGDFDKALINTAKSNNLLANKPTLHNIDNNNQIMCYHKDNFLFVVNLSISSAIEGYQIGVPSEGNWVAILSSDDSGFGGHQRISNETKHPTTKRFSHGFNQSISIYTVPRSAVIYKCLK